MRPRPLFIVLVVTTIVLFVHPLLVASVVWLTLALVVALTGRPERTLVVAILLTLVAPRPLFGVPIALVAPPLLCFCWGVRTTYYSGRSRSGSPRTRAGALALAGIVTCLLLNPPNGKMEWFLTGQWCALILLLVACGLASRASHWRLDQMRELGIAFGVVAFCSVAAAVAGLRVQLTFAQDRQLESLLGGSNYVAALAVLAALAMLSVARDGGRVAAAVAWAAAVAAAILSVAVASRGATASLAVGLLVFMQSGTQSGAGRRRVIGAVVILSLFVVLASSAGELLRERVDAGTGTNGRTELWRAAAATFGRFPLTGVGPGGLPAAFRDEGIRGALYAHNIALSALAQFGAIVGTLVLIAFSPRLPVLRHSHLAPALAAAVLTGFVEPSIEVLGYGALYLSILVMADAQSAQGGVSGSVNLRPGASERRRTREYMYGG